MRPSVVHYLNGLFETDIFGALVPAYTHMLAIAFLVGSWLSVRSMRRDQHLPELPCVIALFCAYLGALVGAWLLGFLSMGIPYWLQQPDEPMRMFKKGGMVAYGGFIGGFAAPMLYLKYRARQINPWKVLDAGAPFVALGLFFTRVGCFLAGCDYGKVTDLPWAVTFPAKSPAWYQHVRSEWITEAAARSLPVHPTQLYAALYGLVLFAFFRFVVFPKRRFNGQVVLGLCSTYAVCRFLIEFLRGDVSRGLFGPLSTSQWVSLVVLALMGWLYFGVLRPRAQAALAEADQESAIGKT